MAKKFFSTLALISTFGMVLSLTACNTVAGAGKDVERAGDAIHKKAVEEQRD